MVSEHHEVRNLPSLTTWICPCFISTAAGPWPTPDQAFGVLRRLLADSRHRFVPDDLSCEDRVVRTDLMGGPNQITDRYLVALARQHKLMLATFDEPLAKSFVSESDLVILVR